MFQLVEKRFKNSKTKWQDVVADNYKFNDKNSIWTYIYNRSMHKPREIIQFLIKLQNTFTSETKLSRDGQIHKNFRRAEKEYSEWLLDELSNEMSNFLYPNGKQLADDTFNTIRSITVQKFQTDIFENALKEKNLDADKIIPLLYDVSAIGTIRYDGIWSFSHIQQDRYKREDQITVHNGLHLSLFLVGKGIVRNGIFINSIDIDHLLKQHLDIPLTPCSISSNVDEATGKTQFFTLIQVEIKNPIVLKKISFNLIPLNADKIKIDNVDIALQPKHNDFQNMINWLQTGINEKHSVRIDLPYGIKQEVMKSIYYYDVIVSVS